MEYDWSSGIDAIERRSLELTKKLPWKDAIRKPVDSTEFLGEV